LQLNNEIALLEQRLTKGSANQLADIKQDFDAMYGVLTSDENLSQEILLLAYQFE
jgi:hypothetical protein